MKLTQKQVLQMTKHMLSRLQESTSKYTARKKIESALDTVKELEDMLEGDSFYDSILLRNEKTLVEVDLEQHQMEKKKLTLSRLTVVIVVCFVIWKKK